MKISPSYYRRINSFLFFNVTANIYPPSLKIEQLLENFRVKKSLNLLKTERVVFYYSDFKKNRFLNDVIHFSINIMPLATKRQKQTRKIDCCTRVVGGGLWVGMEMWFVRVDGVKLFCIIAFEKQCTVHET